MLSPSNADLATRWNALRGEKPALRIRDAAATLGVSEAELARVKTQWVASEVYKRDSVMGQAQELGSLWIQGLPMDADVRLMQRLRTVTAAHRTAAAAAPPSRP